jgi:hypothetical protein
VAGVGVVAGFGTALAQAQRITEGAARVRALSGIARTAAATDSRDHAVAIAQEAASLADTVGFPGRRPDALAVAVGALVATGLCDAGRELASGIGDPWARAEAFVCVAAGPPIPIPAADPPAGEDAGALREALSAARSVSNSAWRAEAQAAVVAAMCRLGDPDRALATAETIADPVWRAEALLAVAAADRTGREAAVSLLDRATRLGRSVGYPWWQTGRLARVLARLLTAAPGDQSLLEPSRTARILVGVARVLGARPPGGGTRAALSAVLDALAAADLTDLLATDLLASCTCAYPECAVELRALAAGAGA